MFATWCCELCGHELRNLLLLCVMIILWCLLLGVVTCCYLVLWICGHELRNLLLPDHNMMFAARWTAKFWSIDVLLRTFLRNDRDTSCFLLWFQLVVKFNKVPRVSLIKNRGKLKDNYVNSRGRTRGQQLYQPSTLQGAWQHAPVGCCGKYLD
jgi:hypothetical protein